MMLLKNTDPVNNLTRPNPFKRFEKKFSLEKFGRFNINQQVKMPEKHIRLIG
jgi:hypothetical protein